MLHFIFIFTSLFSSTVDFITKPLQEPGQSCNYRAIHLPPEKREANGKDDPSLWKPDPSGGIIPNIRHAASIFSAACPSTSYDEDLKNRWPRFDSTPELSELPKPLYDTPLGLLTIIYTPSICHPFDRQKIWQENFENAHTLQTIENLLAGGGKSHSARPILLQLYAVGSLMLAGVSKTMYDKLSLLFQEMRFQMNQFYGDRDANKIQAPKKSCFLDKMHSRQTPFQFIGVFAHITRWLIKYQSNLRMPHDRTLRKNVQELHEILTTTINGILSPAHFKRHLSQQKIDLVQWDPVLTDCFTAAWVPDAFIEIFTEFAKKQKDMSCHFHTLVQHYEKLAGEAVKSATQSSLKPLPSEDKEQTSSTPQ